VPQRRAAFRLHGATARGLKHDSAVPFRQAAIRRRQKFSA
jgi:hypothetical protein